MILLNAWMHINISIWALEGTLKSTTTQCQSKSKSNVNGGVLHSSHGVVSNVLDCYVVVSEFELRLSNYVLFRTNAFVKGINTRIALAMG